MSSQTSSREDLESLIRRYVPLGKASAGGYESVKCAKCNDRKTRGGFKFELGAVIFHCFNCSTSCRYEPVSAKRVSRSFREVLVAFGIPEDEITQATYSERFSQDQLINLVAGVKPVKEPRVVSLPVNAVPLPKGAVLVTSDESPWCEVARAYLESRALSWSSYPFYVTDDPAYSGRVIIPYFFRGKIIYWQGRSLDPSIEPRYKNPSVEKENILFNMDEAYRYTSDPLLVTEGATDALSLGPTAVSLTGSSLGEFRERALTVAATRRKVIFIIDKNKVGFKLGEKVLSDENREWYVTCFPDNVEDANDALQKLGRLWIANHVASTAVKGFQGRVLLKMNCKT